MYAVFLYRDPFKAATSFGIFTYSTLTIAVVYTPIQTVLLPLRLLSTQLSLEKITVSTTDKLVALFLITVLGDTFQFKLVIALYSYCLSEVE